MGKLETAALEYSKHNGVMLTCSQKDLIDSHATAFVRGAIWQQQQEGENIDWEQRKYEIAKGSLLNLINTNLFDNKSEDIIATAIDLANNLIKQLKEV